MLAEVEWSALELAGSFLVGALLATIATIRIFRYVIDYFNRRGQ